MPRASVKGAIRPLDQQNERRYKRLSDVDDGTKKYQPQTYYYPILALLRFAPWCFVLGQLVACMRSAVRLQISVLLGPPVELGQV